MAPFMLARLSEKPAGFGDGNELSAAIEKMAQGPRLADVWDIDRKLALVFSAWIEMRQRLASYNAVTSAPWNEASKRFFAAMSAAGTSGAPPPDWREAFAKWSEISNEELIRNQRTDGFLQAQKELLQAGLQLRSRQDDVAEAASAMPFETPGITASISGNTGTRSRSPSWRSAGNNPICSPKPFSRIWCVGIAT